MANDKAYLYDLICLKRDLKKPKQTINTIVDEVKKDIEDTERMCRVTSNNVSSLLNRATIPNVIMSTNAIVGSYEHMFVIAYYRTDRIYYHLIDLAFDQFKPEDGRILLPTFKNWPADILRRTKVGTELLEEIIKKGHTELNNEKFSAYINSFGDVDGEIILEDVILSQKMKQIKKF